MLGVIIAISLILLTISIFLLQSKSANSNSTPQNQKKVPKSSPEKSQNKPQPKPQERKPEKENDCAKYLLKTIKEDKEMTHCYFYNNGHFILFCNQKKVSLCYLKSINSKSQKIYSKNIDRDLINDISFSPITKTVVCASKNSKSILFYELANVDGKIKLNKVENKSITTQRPYEINSIVMNHSGDMICTSGTDDDTEIQIYNSNSLERIFKQSTGGIHNFQMIMATNDTDLLISTFMNDISVINFNKNEKFNSTTKKYETIYSITRNHSISGIKSKMLFSTMSNDEKFFAVSTEDKNIKILRNYGNISESKVFSQFSLDHTANIISLYVDDFEGGRLNGLVATSNEGSIHIYDLNGNKKLDLIDGHESNIIGLYLCKVDLKKNEEVGNEMPEIVDCEQERKMGEYCLISAASDGKVKFWKID